MNKKAILEKDSGNAAGGEAQQAVRLWSIKKEGGPLA